MRKPETLFRTRVWGRLKDVPNSWFESIQQKAIRGTPDILGCVNGVFVAIELKATPKDQPTALQTYKLSKIAEAGGLGLLVHPGNLDSTMVLINGLSEKKDA